MKSEILRSGFLLSIKNLNLVVRRLVLKKIKANQELYAMYEEWKEEAEIQVRSIGVRSAMEMARDGKSFAAAKWLAEAGYDKRGAGRPSKEEIVRETRIASRVKDELEEDYERLLGGMSE